MTTEILLDINTKIIATTKRLSNISTKINARYNAFGISDFVVTPTSGTFIPGSSIYVAISGSISGGRVGSYYSWRFYYGDGEDSGWISGINKFYFIDSHYYSGYRLYISQIVAKNQNDTQSINKYLTFYSWPGIKVADVYNSGATPFNSFTIATATSGLSPYTYKYYYGDGEESAPTGASSSRHWYLYSDTYNATVKLTDGLGTSVSGTVTLRAIKPSRSIQSEQAQNVVTKLYNLMTDITKIRADLIKGIDQIISLSGMYREALYQTYASGSITASSLASDVENLSGCLDYINLHNPSGAF